MQVKKIISFAIGPLSVAVIGLFTLPLIAWFYSPEDIGRFSMLQVVLSLVFLIYGGGLDQAYMREYHEDEKKGPLFKAVVTPGLILLILTMLFLMISPWVLSQIVFDESALLINFMLYLIVLISFINRFLTLILRMKELGMVYSAVQILPKLLFITILILFIFTKEEFVFEDLMIANTWALLITFMFIVFKTKNDWMEAFNSTIDWTRQKRLFVYAIPLIGAGIAFWGLTTIDKVLLKSISGLHELGVYSVAVNFAGAALLLQVIFSTVWAPLVYKWAKQGVDSQKIKDVMDYTVVGIVLIWSVLGMFSWVFTFLLPLEYSEVKNIVLAVVAYPLLHTLSESSGIGIGIVRKTIYTFFAALVSFSINVVLNYLLIPDYGAKGSAVSLAISFFIYFMIRAEVSAKIWCSFERRRMYIMVSALSLVSCIINLNYFEYYYISLAYLILALCGIYLFRVEVNTILGIFLKKLNL